jgi:hypothetical protein
MGVWSKTACNRLRCAALPWLLLVALCCQGQQFDWFPVTARDLALTGVPGNPGASAVQLDYSDATDDTLRSRFIHRRIKILNNEGRQYGDVVIPVPAGYTVSDIRGRTIRPNGSVVEFTGKPFERVVFRRYPQKLIAWILTMPDVHAGSIVEYKYRLNWDQYVYDTVWSLEHELYTLREKFWLRPYRGRLQTRHGGDDTQLSYVYSNMPEGVTPRETAAGIELTVENVPAFTPENLMPPEDNFKPEVRFFYGGREMESSDAFWRDIGRVWDDKAEHFMGRRKEMEAAAAEIIEGETDARQKLRKLYARVQRIRNLSYEHSRSRAEARQEELKPNDNAAHVLSRGHGYPNEIAELFTVLARAAGFEATLLRASSREARVFDQKVLSENQLAWEIVRVKLGNEDVFLDPGTMFCPFEMVAWQHTSAPALKLDKEGGEFVVVPTPTADKTVTRRSANMALTPEGLLQGEITLEFKGNDALQRRLDALETDEAGRRRDLEDQLLNWLPAGARVKLQEAQGWETSDQPLLARFHAEVPGFATHSGRRLLVPAGLFKSPQLEISGSGARTYPVYFPYTYEEIDNIVVQLPDGFSAGPLPNPQDTRLPSTRFITTSSFSGGQLKLTRALIVNSIYFKAEQYPEVQGFLRKLQDAGNGQIVLEGPSSAK